MLKEKLEQLFELIAQHIPSEKIMLAKKKFQKISGETYEDDKSYITRMALFLEWYLLDNYKPGTKTTILERIKEDNLSTLTPELLEVCQDIANNIQALFEVKNVRDNSVTVIDLFKNKKYQINENDAKLIFRKNDIFQGRIVFHQAKWHFTGNFCFHPNKNQNFIKDEIKKISALHLSWEKELSILEKELSKSIKASLKNIKDIEKVKVKIEHTNFISVKDRLSNKLLELEKNNRQFEQSIQETEKKISTLKNETINIKGRRLISELINRLSCMNLTWERSRQIAVTDIYKN
tara:strand:- start:250 stop:1125 length:876 start_codon:yes stop_codon:yes gene_type:complete